MGVNKNVSGFISVSHIVEYENGPFISAQKVLTDKTYIEWLQSSTSVALIFLGL